MKYIALLLTVALMGCGGSSSSTNVSGDLVAQKIGSVPGRGGCGVSNAYLVTQASGVRLTQAATLNLKTAQRLHGWLTDHAKPIIGKRGGGLVAIDVAAHYACRTRNSRPGAKLSEHAKGNAIDISAFILADGSRISVLGGWRGGDSRVLRKLHRSACGPFGTVLGPDADRFHQDHFHFDTADHRGGAYCR
ncbi:MAG: extensin family protein [Paracoccaceae bacterium]|nr:extensin family protein [Paracoccaceae bacterium]